MMFRCAGNIARRKRFSEVWPRGLGAIRWRTGGLPGSGRRSIERFERRNENDQVEEKREKEMLERRTSMAEMKPFIESKPGLGAATIHSYYDHLGGEVKVPSFLKLPKTAGIGKWWGLDRRVATSEPC